MKTTTDRIEKTLLLRAPRTKVWRALTTLESFSTWFEAKLEGTFAVGQRVSGHITSKGWEHVRIEIDIEKLEPETYFSYRWHPFAIDPKVDYSKEPTTLIEFRLEEVPEGTQLSVVESGFDALPASRREKAFHMNSEGWAGQLENVKRYVGG